MAIEYFNAYHSYLKSIEPLNDAERGRLFTALLEYSSTGVTPDLRGNERFIFPTMKEQIDRDMQKYEAKCNKNRENVLRRYTDVNDGIRTDTKSTKEKAKEKEKAKAKAKAKEKESTPPISPSRGTRFIPPTPDEVRAYCLERGGRVSAEKWYDYYTANGWKVGKNPMKDWKAAVRNWERTEKHGGSRDTGFETSNPFLEMMEERRGMG